MMAKKLHKYSYDIYTTVKQYFKYVTFVLFVKAIFIVAKKYIFFCYIFHIN